MAAVTKNSGSFKPGHKPAGTRKRGVANKITRDLKEGIIDAAVAIGSDGNGKDGLVGYLTMLARKHPKYFAPLLGRLMPLQINATPGSFIGAVNIMGVPNDRYVTSEQIKAMYPAVAEPITIDNDNDNVVEMKS